ncbi:CpaF family protein [bacterium]|nr:CpaF family protein [bacterium]
MGFRTGFRFGNAKPTDPNGPAAKTADQLPESFLKSAAPSRSASASATKTLEPAPVIEKQIRPERVEPPARSLSIKEIQKLVDMRRDLHRRLLDGIDLTMLGQVDPIRLREEVGSAASTLIDEIKTLLSVEERNWLIEEVINEIVGLGPLERLLTDPSISEIMVNGPRTTFIERSGKLVKADVVFNDNEHLVQIIQRIVGKVGRRIDEATPLCDARLPDGSRVNAVIPPIALDGAILTIRRFGKHAMTPQVLVEKGAMVQEMLEFLSACINARINTIISGGTGSGKTTLLNALSSFIDDTERITTIEDAAELRLQQNHIVRMETRPASIEGTGEITTRDLVRNALRMRPDRIIVGECRGGEALDMLQAMNTGHAGSMTTIHANDTRDAMSRLEMMIGMSGFDLPIWIVRRQIASAIQLVVQVSRLPGGLRKVTKISEILGMEGDILSMQDIFTFEQTGVDENHVAVGYHASTGIRPNFLDQLSRRGKTLPLEMFIQRRLTHS